MTFTDLEGRAISDIAEELGITCYRSETGAWVDLTPEVADSLGYYTAEEDDETESGIYCAVCVQIHACVDAYGNTPESINEDGSVAI